MLIVAAFSIIIMKSKEFNLHKSGGTRIEQGFRYMRCVYWPLLTAVFSCLQIVPPMNKMKGAKNEKSGKSGKKLQFY